MKDSPLIPNKTSYRSVIVKVFFFIVALTLSLIWIFSVNEKGYNRISEVISDYFKPDEKLIHLNQLRDEVTNLLNLQQYEIYLDHQKPSEKFKKESKAIDNHLDTLQLLMADEPSQIEKIMEIDSLLESRKKLFASYLKIRYNYSLDINFQDKFGDINNILTKKVITADTTTVVIAPEKKKFKLFQSKKKKAQQQANVQEEQKIEVKIDTVQIVKRDSVLNKIQTSIDEIKVDQEKNKIQMKNREILLINTNELIVSEILTIIKNLEEKQRIIASQNNRASEKLALDAIETTKSILIIISLVSIALAIYIIWDFIKIVKIKNELEIAKKEAEFHSQAKQNFLANMSHEIRTPLQSIVGYSEILNKKFKDPGISTINSSSKHLLHIVNEILDYGKIISGKYSFNEQPFNVQEIFDEAWTISMLNPKAKKLELVQDYQFEQLYLLGDDFRLKQILLNLINNAIKYTEEGTVSLEAKTTLNDDKAILEFTITDTGIGIPKSKLSSIFDEYQQADNTHLSKGTGLGLSIVKELVEGQKGEISVISEEHQGSAFTVRIPYQKSSAANLKNEEAEKEDYTFIDGHICFVEDDSIIQNLIKEFVGDFIKDSKIFNDAEEFLQSNVENIDCLVSDIRLTGISGIELIKTLRRNGFDKPVIAVTAQVLKEEHDEIYAAGFNGILVKPFTKKSLQEILAKHNEQHLKHIRHNSLNFSGLKKMIEDSSSFEQIIKKFIRDTKNEIEYLRSLNHEQSMDEIHLLVHRISGRLLQIGSERLGEKWRQLEYLIINDPDNVTQKVLNEYFDELTHELNAYR